MQGNQSLGIITLYFLLKNYYYYYYDVGGGVDHWDFYIDNKLGF